MSFGWKDSEWVDVGEHPPIPCEACDHWDRCPDGCKWGWCSFYDMWTKEGESCE